VVMILAEDDRSMKRLKQLLAFSLEGQLYALYLSSVEKIVRVVAVTPLPKGPEIVLGVVNVHGVIIPVVNIRKRFGLPERAIDLSDQLIIAQTPGRPVALIVDAVSGVVERRGEEIVGAEKILPGLEYIEGVVKFEDGMILIHDLDKFLSMEEEGALNEAMKKI
jgi:purine-binding chemotaxis protein CheW